MALSRKNFSNYITKHPKAGLVIMSTSCTATQLRSSNEVIAYEKKFMVSADDLDAIALLPSNVGYAFLTKL